MIIIINITTIIIIIQLTYSFANCWIGHVSQFWKSIFCSPLISSSSWSVFYFFVFSVIYYDVFCVYVCILCICCQQLLPYSHILPQTGVLFSSFAISLFLLQSVQVYLAVCLIYFISAAAIILANNWVSHFGYSGDDLNAFPLKSKL